jgi:uncharacterized protein
MLPQTGYFSVKKFLLLLFSLIIIVPIYIYLTNPLLVTVSGTGEVEAKPDTATVAFVVAMQRDTSDRARTDAEAKAKALESVLIGFGIDKSNIVRSQVSVTPSGSADAAKAYTATISMGAKLDDYGKVGSLISSLYSNGAYYVSQPVLSSNSMATFEIEAYDKAVKNAESEASRISVKNLKFIKKRVSISQTTVGGAGSITSLNSQTANDTSGKAVDPNAVFTDALKVTKVVTVIYKMW